MSGRRDFAELDLKFSRLSIDAKRPKFVVKNTISKDPTSTADSASKGLSSLLRNRGELSSMKFVDRQEKIKRKDFGKLIGAGQEVRNSLATSKCSVIKAQ
jgi:hypothetical protein